MNREPSEGISRYIGIGLQLSATILIGLFLGYFVDRKLNTIPWFTLTGSAVGFVVAFVNLISELKGNKDQNESN